ncbi:hypothetical protein PAPHI01_0275 [Pancytospora philotis]|nr:hypothetical protein PAPHI01_0275 [Pancytospora philotis]
MKAKLAEYFKGIQKFSPKSKTHERAAALKLSGGPCIRKQALNGRGNEGRRFLVKCRLGTLITYNDLVRMNRLPGAELGRCLGCSERIEESIEHILLDCRIHADGRAQIVGETLLKLSARCPGRWRRQALSWLMGGNVHQATLDIVNGRGAEKEQLWRRIAAERQRATLTCTRNVSAWLASASA